MSRSARQHWLGFSAGQALAIVSTTPGARTNSNAVDLAHGPSDRKELTRELDGSQSAAPTWPLLIDSAIRSGTMRTSRSGRISLKNPLDPRGVERLRRRAGGEAGGPLGCSRVT